MDALRRAAVRANSAGTKGAVPPGRSWSPNQSVVSARVSERTRPRAPQGEFLSHGAAEGMTHQVEVAETDARDHLCRIGHEPFDRIRGLVRGAVGCTVSAVVQDQYAMIWCELRDLVRPVLFRAQVAMQEHDGVSGVTMPLVANSQSVDDRGRSGRYSHSIVAGGLLETS